MDKKIKIAILGCFLLVIVFGIYSWYSSSHKYLSQKPVSLNPAVKQALNAKITQLNSEIKKATSNDVKFDLYKQLGVTQETLGNLSKSEDAYKKAIKIKPNDYTAYLGLAQTLVERQNIDGAKQTMEKARSLGPHGLDMWIQYISFQQNTLHTGNDQLRELYVLAINQTKNNSFIISNFAQFLESIGDLQGALDNWKLALASDPNNSNYKGNVARLQAELYPQTASSTVTKLQPKKKIKR